MFGCRLRSLNAKYSSSISSSLPVISSNILMATNSPIIIKKSIQYIIISKFDIVSVRSSESVKRLSFTHPMILNKYNIV